MKKSMLTNSVLLSASGLIRTYLLLKKSFVLNLKADYSYTLSKLISAGEITEL